MAQQATAQALQGISPSAASMTGAPMPSLGAGAPLDIAGMLNRTNYQSSGTTTTVSPTGQVTVTQPGGPVSGITQGPLSGLGQIPTGPLGVGGPASYTQWQAAAPSPAPADWYTQWQQRQAADAAAAQAAAATFPQYAFGG
jgi:hypothetical protein